MTGRLLGRTVIYLAVNALFIVTLAFASHSTTGDTTVLSYAYLFCSYLVAGTGMALGMSRIADMSRASGEERRTTIVDGRILNDGGELTVEVTGELSLPLHRQRHAHRDAGPAGGRPT